MVQCQEEMHVYMLCIAVCLRSEQNCQQSATYCHCFLGCWHWHPRQRMGHPRKEGTKCNVLKILSSLKYSTWIIHKYWLPALLWGSTPPPTPNNWVWRVIIFELFELLQFSLNVRVFGGELYFNAYWAVLWVDQYVGWSVYLCVFILMPCRKPYHKDAITEVFTIGFLTKKRQIVLH